jgi:hypothetical protein
MYFLECAKQRHGRVCLPRDCRGLVRNTDQALAGIGHTADRVPLARTAEANAGDGRWSSGEQCRSGDRVFLLGEGRTVRANAI